MRKDKENFPNKNDSIYTGDYWQMTIYFYNKEILVDYLYFFYDLPCFSSLKYESSAFQKEKTKQEITTELESEDFFGSSFYSNITLNGKKMYCLVSGIKDKGWLAEISISIPSNQIRRNSSLKSLRQDLESIIYSVFDKNPFQYAAFGWEDLDGEMRELEKEIASGKIPEQRNNHMYFNENDKLIYYKPNLK